jgi:hypothetical protein
MTDNKDLIHAATELLHETPDAVRAVGITDELNLQGWLSARNLRLVPADPREAEVSPGFWIAEHHDGRCVVMYDESPYDQPPADVTPSDLHRGSCSSRSTRPGPPVSCRRGRTAPRARSKRC